MSPGPSQLASTNGSQGAPSAADGRRGAATNPASPTAKAAKSGVIHMERLKWTGGIMGCVSRSSITGGVRLKRQHKDLLETGDLVDFSIVDLWRRDVVEGTPQVLDPDPFLFKAYPLTYRTWIYHYIFKSKVVINSADENATVRNVLSYVCTDGPISGGRWAPVMAMVPFTAGTALTGDRVLTLLACVVLAFFFFLSSAFNTPDMYRLLRPLTVLPRLLYYSFMLSQMDIGPGFFLSLMSCLVDFIAGDLSMVFDYRYNCSYTVEKVLPHRVYICRRTGAADYENKFGQRGSIDEKISGRAAWDPCAALIADINGILTELRPVNYLDWMMIMQRVEKTEKEEPCCGIDVFDDESPDARTIEANARAKRLFGQFMPD